MLSGVCVWGGGSGEAGGRVRPTPTDPLHGVRRALTCSGINKVNQSRSIAIHLFIYFYLVLTRRAAAVLQTHTSAYTSAHKHTHEQPKERKKKGGEGGRGVQ